MALRRPWSALILSPSLAALGAALVCLCAPTDRPVRADEPPAVVARVLGVVQDGGLPHLGCVRSCCEMARRDPSRAGKVASLALVVGSAAAQRRVFLIDATPDLRAQLDSVLGETGRAGRPPRSPLDGILLTHAHVGHYAGLIYLGRESMSADHVPLFVTARMGAFLSANGPWKRLVDGGNVDLRILKPGARVELAPGLSVEPVAVPHRSEESDVVGYLVTGPTRRLLYIPDIDSWDRWDRDIAQLAATVDIALLDGTFFSAAELPGRSLVEIPHPLIPSTMDRLAGVARAGHRIIFTHMNHTNPVLQEGSPERAEVERRGFLVATESLELPL